MKGVAFRDRAAFLRDPGVLVVADVHVGRDESSGVAFPLGEREDLRGRLEALLEHFRPETVVFAGDVIHAFDGVSERTRGSLAALAKTCRDAGADLRLVAGNHDVSLATAWDDPVSAEEVVDRRSASDGATPVETSADGTSVGGSSTKPETVVCHGHEPPETAARQYLLGHVHPTIVIEGDRRPCFLHGEGTYRGADVLLLPAFNRLAPGVVVNDMAAADFGTPLVTDPDRLRPYVYDPDSQETLEFPPLGEFRDLL